jgi:hypothetical protein
VRARRRFLGSLVVSMLVVTSCTLTGGSATTPSPAAPVPVSPQHPSPAPEGPGSAVAALEALCPKTHLATASGVPPEGTVPAPIAAVERAVEEMRALRFIHPVIPDPVTHGQLVRGLLKSFDTSYPKALYDRRTLAWQTIGVIPHGTSIRHALENFGSSAVIGYYDTLTGKLVFIGTKDPTPYERDTLAHELTHAIDDQHFGLERLDRLGATCQDEASAASVAVVEGNATYVQLQYVRQFLTPTEQLQFVQEANASGGSAGDIPPFIMALQQWSYTQGLQFITALVAHGGETAVDHALTVLPVSTEQIIHPERYPNDVPTPVDVPDFGPKLGRGWTDLDVEGIGEEWLSLALALRLPVSDAASAAAGWDGGISRAWSDGTHVAVVLSTVWDTAPDAAEFASAMSRWIGAGDGQPAKVLPPSGTSVRVLFASDGSTLGRLETAAH